MESQLDDCFNVFAEEHLREYSERVAKILKISSPKFGVKSCTKKGDNFVGIIYRVSFEGKRNGIPEKISTILKVPPRNELTRLKLQVPHFFPREHLFYSEIVTLLKELLQTHNKTLENIPKCYFSSSDDHKEAIYLEDLQPLGFVMRDRIKQLDFAHMSLALHALGRFHALSFALRDQRSEVFAGKVKILKEPLFRPDLIHSSTFIDRFEKLGNLVKMALTGEDSKYTERFTVFAKDVLGHIEWSCTGMHAEPYGVLTHGDLWTNNMLFHYGKDSMEPRDLYFVDFQVSRYASPAIDISYILYTSCSQELREQHYDELIRIYHESLSSYLRELGADPKKLFPYDALLNQLKKFSRIAGVWVTLVLAGLTSQGGDMDDDPVTNNDTSVLEKRLQRDHFWRNNLKDAIKDLIDRNYI